MALLNGLQLGNIKFLKKKQKVYKLETHNSLMPQVFGKAESKAMSYILYKANKPIKVLEVAKAVKVSKGYVSRIVRALEGEKLIKSGLLDIDKPEVRALKILFNVNRLVSSGAIKELKKLNIAGAGIYGSWANGTNDEESDLDIWVKPSGEMHEKEIAPVLRQVRKAVGANPQLIVLNKSRLRQLKQGNQIFFYSLLYGSLRLFGEGIE